MKDSYLLEDFINSPRSIEDFWNGLAKSMIEQGALPTSSFVSTSSLLKNTDRTFEVSIEGELPDTNITLLPNSKSKDKS